MSEAIEIRIEIDYGLEYLNKSVFLESDNLRNAILCIRESRMAIGRYAFYTGSSDPYKNMGDERNNIIELSSDVVDKSIIEVNDEYSEVKHIKFMVRGFRMILDKIIKLRMQRLSLQNSPDLQLLAMRSVDRSIDLMETGICYLGASLREISMSKPGEYPETKDEMVKMVPDYREVPEENTSTDKIMEQRSKENTDEK